MVANREITIALDDSFTHTVCDFSVGFLRFKTVDKKETARPIGTGTFVKFKKVHGILTAAHVLSALGKSEVIGLVRFPSLPPYLQNRRLNLSHTERLVNWNGKDCDAPDIAFLKIPEVDANDLGAVGAVFYNLELDRNYKAGKPEHRMAICHAIVGVVEEWTEENLVVGADGQKQNKLEVGGLFGNAKELRGFKEGDTELVEVEIDHAEGPRVPKSYGGVSGGALWELFVELDQNDKQVSVKKKTKGRRLSSIR